MKLALLLVTVAAAFAQKTVVVRPVEIDDVLVNPEMGIQTFQRTNGDPINPGSRWSEAGPPDRAGRGAGQTRFPGELDRLLSLVLVAARAGARQVCLGGDRSGDRARAQPTTRMVDFRLMPYDQSHPLPEWYRNSGARRANKPEDSDGKIWSPDADDPRYAQALGRVHRRRRQALQRASGRECSRHFDGRLLGRRLGALSAGLVRAAASDRSVFRGVRPHAPAHELRRAAGAGLRDGARRRAGGWIAGATSAAAARA